MDKQTSHIINPHRQEGRRVLSYRWMYICTGLVFLASLLFLIYLSYSFESEAEAIEDQIKILGEQQVLSQKLKAVATEYWSPDAKNEYLNSRLQEIVTRFRTLMGQLDLIASELQRKSYFTAGMESKLAILNKSWRDMEYQLGLDSHYFDESEKNFLPTPLGQTQSLMALYRIQGACDQLLRDCSDFMQDTLAAQGDNQSNRSWLTEVFIACLFVCGMLMMWFLWSSTANRMEILALNMLLEKRVEERAGELERINLHLSNVQSSITTALIVTDSQSRILTWNPAAEKLWGISRKRAEGHDIFAIQPIRKIQEFHEAFEKARQSAHEAILREFKIKDGMGYEKFCNASLVPMLGPMAEPCGVVILVDDVTEMVRTREELAIGADKMAKTNEVLKRVNCDLEQIVYAASHDLRSPLVNLRGLTHKLDKACDQARFLLDSSEGVGTPQDLQGIVGLLDHDIPKVLSRINNSINKFGAIIDGLLQFSRSGRQEYVKASLDMEQEVADVVALFAATIEETDVQIFVGDLPPAWGDANAVNQVLTNLLDNALNYLSPDRPGEIVIEGESLDNHMCRYYVRDNGVGIEKKDVNKVFTIFQRAHADMCSGEGMGLAIARKIIERHGGQIAVDSEWDRGTTFWFTLPAVKPEIKSVTVKRRTYR